MSKIKNNAGRKNQNSTPKRSGKHEKFDISEEIVIGLNTETIKPKRNRLNIEEAENGPRKSSKFIKILCIMFLILIAILLFIMSPIFNIETITVTGNEKLSMSEYIKLSGLEIGQNIYKLNKRQIKNNIKQNAYVENVYVSRKLPNVIDLTIEERKATYILELENGEYAYINNQGYILEKNYTKTDLVTITGYSTEQEKITAGNRLVTKDLNKLEVVLRIVDSASRNDLLQYINRIDITDKNNYTLILESENKTVYLGDASSINTRMLYLKAILEKEKDVEGEIFINGNLNTDKVYFREKV